MTELKSLFQSVARVIEHASGIKKRITPDEISPLAVLWYNNKEFFREHFPESLIWEYPEIQSFCLSQSEKNRRMNDFIEKYQYNTDVFYFLSANRATFYSNKTANDYSFKSGWTTITIPKGMKIAKALNQFFYDDNMDELISEYSRIIQSDKITGRLCISIHPLDFLSISENTLNWRSCHALDGDYRGGNLNYMCDDVTFVTYIKTEEEPILPRFRQIFPWNNKMWRDLMFLDRSRNILWSGRHYPFFSETILNEIKYALIKLNILDNIDRYARWSSNIVNMVQLADIGEIMPLNEDYVYFSGHMARLGRWITNAPGTYQFNDLISSSCYKPWMLMYSYRDDHIRMNSISSMKVGAAAPCPCCGKFNALSSSNQLICPDCYSKYRNSIFDDYE